MRHLFIVLDGPDASGTTTHAALLAEKLQSEGHEVLLTAEPTDGPIGKRIRQELKNGKMDPLELQKLFTEDRAWHVQNVIEPALQDGKIVVCDRYWYSTIIYAAAQNQPLDELQEMNNKFIQPDCVIFTLPPLSVSLERMKGRKDRELFEREDMQKKIWEGYSAMAKQNPQIHVVDTSGEKESAGAEIWRHVKKAL